MSDYRIPVLDHFSWQLPVIDKDLASPPASVKGDRYIVGTSATGGWVGQDGKIAYYSGTAWLFDVPLEGWVCWVDDENVLYFYDGSSWTTSGMIAEADPIFLSWLSAPPNVSAFNNDAGYLTSYTETDPVFSVWDRSTGISIVESQVTDLDKYTKAEAIALAVAL